MKAILISFYILSSSLLASKINIAVAANVSYAINDLKNEFRKTHPEIKIQVTLGGSGKLVTQIKHGAPYGLFMSANMLYPESLYQDSLTISKPVVYAKGALVFFSLKQINYSHVNKVLNSKEIKKVAIANPKTAPYGKASVEALKNSGIYAKIKNKFVYAESISQAVAYSVSAADIGIIAKSTLYSPKMSHYKEGINYKEIDSTLYTPIKQGIVLLKTKDNTKEYKAFYDFILSDKAKIIFKKYGYLTI